LVIQLKYLPEFVGREFNNPPPAEYSNSFIACGLLLFLLLLLPCFLIPLKKKRGRKGKRN
jgi:hypothetical protein